MHQKPTIIDLNVDRSLLNPNFECYRVSIDPMVTYSHSFPNSVSELRLKDEEYSYLHLSMASQFNHLFADPYSVQTVFLATNSGQIICVSIEVVSGELTKPKVVYSVPEFGSSFVSISFPNSELSLIALSNSTNPSVLLMSTPNRSAAEPWLPIKSINLEDNDIKNSFYLSCSHSIDLVNSSLQIDFILSFVDKKPDKESKKTSDVTQSSFISVLNWFTIAGNLNDSDSWNVKRLRKLNGKDWPKYIAFDFVGSPFLCLVSNKDFNFIYDSDKPIDVNVDGDQIATSEPKPIYTYSQSLEDICVTFKLSVHLSKNNISIDLKPNTIAVKIKDVIEFEGQLYDTIEDNSSVWTLMSEKDFQLLEITVNKVQKGSVWKEFIKDDKNGIEIINNEMIDDIHQKLKHLTPEVANIGTEDTSGLYNPIGLEECDFTMESLVFNRYNGNNHRISHRIDLTGNQWLFTIPAQKSLYSDSSELPYFVVRHDVDALVWGPQSSADINQFRAVHLATFAAIGYVHASKTNTRFIVGANNFKFVAIADGLRHVYVYRQPIDIQSGELRNRKTGREVQTVANQHVINLSDCQFIIGIHATNDDIFVLSNDKVFLIKI